MLDMNRIASLPANKARPITFAHKVLMPALFVVTGILYAVLMIADMLPVWSLAALAGVWVLYTSLNGRLSPATPLDMPILAMLILLGLSWFVSIDRNLSISKIEGLLLGISLYYFLTNYLWRTRQLRLVIPALVVLSIGVSALGLVGADWDFAQATVFSPIYARLPHLISAVPRSTFNGINVNTVGGALGFFIPLLFSLLWDQGAFNRTFISSKQKFKTSIYKLSLVFAFCFCGALLVLTQSRGAMLGSAVGMLVVAIWKNRRFLWILPILLAAFLLFFFFVAHGNLSSLVTNLDSNEYSTLPGRLEAWRNTIYLIQDFPISGTGIGTYSKLFNEVYTFIPFSLQGAGSAHAHNSYLAVAADLGLPGLILYMSLFSSAVGMANKLVQTSRSITRALVIGLACGLLSHMVFGLTDAYLLGTKLGGIMWIFFGVIAAVYAHQKRFSSHARGLPVDTAASQVRRGTRVWQVLGGLGLWLLFSAAAVAVVNVNVYVSLGIAVGLGIGLGLLVTIGHRPNQEPIEVSRTGSDI